MTDQQANAWQTGRPKNTQQPAASRTPQQSRSGSVTPRASATPQAARQDKNTQQSTNESGSGTHTPINGFNAGEVKAFLKSQASSGPETPAVSGVSSSTRSVAMANGQSFYATLAKQIAALENGG